MNQIINKEVGFLDLGKIDYQDAWNLQERLLEKTVAQKIANRKEKDQVATNNFLLFCEHPHVYTLGKSGVVENLLINEIELQSIDAQFVKINRGGDITYHGPGQLVVYPILDLENFFTDIHRYLRLLEESVILTLDEFDIKADRYQGLTGVWIDVNSSNPRKICAMGVRTSRWVTMHGLALNVNTDLSYFGHIVPCGISDKSVTSIQHEMSKQMSMTEVKKVLRNKLKEVFAMQTLSYRTDLTLL